MLAGGCSLGADVIITGPAVIGHGCRIYKNAVIENSLLWHDITVGEGAIIINSIIAGGAKIKGNARLEGQTINQDAPSDPAANKY
jgi:NDP-sugar pyrophosphorylase family protein